MSSGHEEAPHSAVAWTEVVKAKRAIRDQQTESYEDAIKCSPATNKITAIADVETLTQLLRSGAVSAEEVVASYIERYVSPKLQFVKMLLT